MQLYFDTSVLFPALATAHPHHAVCLQALEEARQKGEILCLSMHVYAELYANLTRFPLGQRILPPTAAETILGLGKFVKTIDLTRADYAAALQRCAAKNLVSGVIYDALHLQAALKAGAEVLYTANLRDFQRLVDADTPIELRGVG